MTKQELNIQTLNNYSLEFKDDFSRLFIQRFEDGEIEITHKLIDKSMDFKLSKDQKELLVKWLSE